MKQKTILVSFIALFAIVLTLSTVSAFAVIDDVIVNGQITAKLGKHLGTLAGKPIRHKK